MNESESTNRDLLTGKSSKKPYEPPKVLSAELLEVVASVCSAGNSPPAKSDELTCSLGPLQS